MVPNRFRPEAKRLWWRSWDGPLASSKSLRPSLKRGASRSNQRPLRPSAHPPIRRLHLSPPGEMLSAMLRRFHRTSFIFLAVAALAPAGCERRAGCTGPNCGTLIDAAVAEPPTLLPPSTEDIVASDIGEQLFLKLADVG